MHCNAMQIKAMKCKSIQNNAMQQYGKQIDAIYTSGNLSTSHSCIG